MPTTIHNLDELKKFATDFVKKLEVAEKTATVVALSGDLGAGKTAFVQAVAEVFKIAEFITSPTFVIQKKYKIQDSPSGFETLFHLDAYRLEGGEELLALGWRETLANPRNLIFVEWAEKVAEILPPNAIKLYFKFIDEQTREIVWELK